MGCENTDFTDYGCVQLCDGVVLNQDSTYTGVMSLKTYFNGIQVNKAFDVVQNEPITIPTEDLNANYQYIIELYNESGVLVEVMSNDPTPTLHEALRITVTP